MLNTLMEINPVVADFFAFFWPERKTCAKKLPSPPTIILTRAPQSAYNRDLQAF